jgi:spermidine synthase
MARLASAALGAVPRPRVLIGGLGLGYTLRAMLEGLGADAQIVVAELAEAIVSWNREPLAHLAGRPLEDPRVRVEIADVRRVMRSAAPWHAILLDVDNGPAALTRASNASLYDSPGLAAAHAALAPQGVLVVWSAGPDERFTARLVHAGFSVETHPVRAGKGRGTVHTLFVARRS